MLAEYYSKRQSYHKISRDRSEAIRRLLPARRPLRILDVGCGSGTLGAQLKTMPGIQVYGIDISPQAVQEAVSVLDGAWTIDIESTAGWPTEILEQRFDAIVISEVLEHLFAPEHLLRKVRSLLADKGVLVITVPNILFWKNRLRIFFGHFEYEDSGLMDRGHIHFFSWQSFNSLFVQEGFKIVDQWHVVPNRFLRPLRNLLPGLVARQFAVSVRPV